MKRVTASEARRNWFRLLDEVAAGEIVYVERGGRRILIQRDSAAPPDADIPDYGRVLRVPDAGEADRWGWTWQGPDRDLEAIGENDDG